MNEVKIQIPDNCELIKDGNIYIVKKKKKDKPRSWEEFCKNYPLRKDEFLISDGGRIIQADSFSIGKCRANKNWCTSKQEAEAFLALMQLRRLRKAWVGDWEQPSSKTPIAVIAYSVDNKKVGVESGNYWNNAVLSFPTQIMAYDFLGCFKDLCETAKMLL